ncbi:rho GTPase-activating protein 11A-like [Dermochelys coriacea]|uniref:rho GTPase-activating protein 11A-like n=1 Tax=Dermochelys coriacea TaxID=27794 RepID=UPI0018E77E5A|nr:rho GTPase-activating protein 11A-like [Dermochelys coriacea]XP_038237830.1 rho GTPase-activating protein 11A-like [Dermochelys coriacea]XP_038237831.1 rho GTPase-activating protein 11A-like [Dermochelys coriacea]XP_038237832.1 rho GTPase-activating protein 11A-like [Dermochelys coriacea]XP_043357347.1 rho GTPase-activating protein 11A-like [Dermochelys coriacea]
MPSLERRELAEAVLRHLRTAGVRLKHWKPTLSDSPCQEKPPLASPASLFGTPLHALPLSENVEGVPRFLVQICEALRRHLHTEGLFRKSGSMTRIKALKAQLEAGESCLDTAAPCDLAALLKQFLRHLPEPLIPAELQEPLCRTQQHPAEGERGPLTLLLSCLLPCHSARALRYFCTFLRDVAARCQENKMDEANLAVIFAPNLFPSCVPSDAPDAERRLPLQAGAMQALISHAPHIGRVPQFLLDKLPAPAPEPASGRQSQVGPRDAGDGLAEWHQRLRRRSVGEIVNGALTKLRVGHGPGGPLAQEPRVDSPSVSSLLPRTLSFGTKRKALEELAQEALLGTKKWRPAVGPAGSDLSTDEAGDSFDQPPDDAPASPPEVFANSPPELPPATGTLPHSTSLHQRKSSCKRHPRRKLSGRFARGSPAPFERQNVGRKSLRIFARSRKELPPPDLAKQDAKATKPSSWHLMKWMVADALEGHRALQSWVPMPLSRPTDLDDGTPAVEGPAAGQSKRDPVPCVGSAEASKESCAKELDLEAWFGSRTGAPHRQQRALRRSLSWPERLSGAEGSVDDLPGVARSGSSPSRPGGGEREPLDDAPGSRPGPEPLGTPMLCVTLAPSSAGAGEGGPEPGEERPAPGSLSQRLPGLDGAPKCRVKRLTLAFPRSPTQPARAGTPKRAAQGRRFGRSLSHESTLPAGSRAKALGQGETSLQPPKNPLSYFRACGRQIFVSHKHLTLAFVGLRGRREPSAAMPNASPRDMAPAPH